VLRLAEKKILDDVIKELEEKAENARKRMDEMEKNIANAKDADKQKLTDLKNQLQKDFANNLSEELNRIKEFVSTGNEIKLTMLDKIYLGVEGVLEFAAPVAAQSVQALRKGLEVVGEGLVMGVDHAFKEVNKAVDYVSKEVNKAVDNVFTEVNKGINSIKNFFGF